MKKNSDFFAGIILFLFVLLAFAQTFYFPDVLTWSDKPQGLITPTPATWPRIVLSILLFLTGLLLFSGISATPADTRTEGRKKIPPRKLRQTLYLVALLLVYLAAMPTIGFATGTFLLGVVFSLVIGRQELKIWKGIAINLAISLGVVITFSRLLYLPFPKGISIFRIFSELLMY